MHKNTFMNRPNFTNLSQLIKFYPNIWALDKVVKYLNYIFNINPMNICLHKVISHTILNTCKV
jgi:hypothetical protein